MFAMIGGRIALWLLLLMIGSGAVLLILIVAALARKRSGVAVATLGVALLGGLVALLIAVPLFVGGVRVVKSHGVNTYPAVETQVAQVQLDVARQRADIERRAAEVNAQLQRQIAGMDIHALMDAADAPRIPLAQAPPLPPAPPNAAPLTAVTVAVASVANTETAESAHAAEPETIQEPAQSEPEAAEAETADEAAQAPDAAKSEPAQEATEAADAAESQTADEANEPAADKTARQASDEAAEAVVTDEDPVAGAATETEIVPMATRPPWVDDPPKRVGNTQRDVIAAGEYQTVDECYRVTDVYLMLATYDHLMQIVGFSDITHSSRPNLTLHRDAIMADGEVLITDGQTADHRLARLKAMGVGIDYIRREIAKDEFVATNERSVGPMKTLYTLIEFTPAVDRDLQARWEASRRGERFAVVGMGAASVLGLLGMAWGLLKVDTLTKGYYTKWLLFLSVPAAIIGGLALLSMLGLIVGLAAGR